jgi:hypothetical protein
VKFRSNASASAQRLVTKDPRFGAYTELFAGLHPGIKEEHNGGWSTYIHSRWLDTYFMIPLADLYIIIVVPFGKHAPVPAALVDPELGRKYWEWTEEQVRPYR